MEVDPWGRLQLNGVVARDTKRVSFSFYTAEEVRRMSVCQLSNPQTFDTLNRPVQHGLYDPRLGPIDLHEM